ncbi:unnamed protein product, partial [Meganyctiphanes norvegica]
MPGAKEALHSSKNLLVNMFPITVLFCESGERLDHICCLIYRDIGIERFDVETEESTLGFALSNFFTHRELRLCEALVASSADCTDHPNVHSKGVDQSRSWRSAESDLIRIDLFEHLEIDIYRLQVNTLRRYKRHYKIPTRPGLNKAQLVDILLKHFRTVPVAEKECLTYFIYMIKANRSKFDQRNGSNIDI